MKRWIVALAAVFLLCSGALTASAEGEAGENLALGCTVEACGFNERGGITGDVVEAPELAVDGDDDTKWDCNVPVHEGLEDNTLHWLILDLGESQTFNKIVLKHASNCTIDKDYPEYNTREMVIETSEDKTNWTECLHILNGDQKAVNTRYFDAVQARYIRLRIIAPGTMDTDARLVEMEIYNSSEKPVEEPDVPLNAFTSSSSEPAEASDASVPATVSSAGGVTASGSSSMTVLIVVLVVIGVVLVAGVVLMVVRSGKKK